MGEWLSYRLSDLLMFTPEVYFRLFERYNEALWPSQLLATALSLGFILTTYRGSPRISAWMAFVLGAAWLLIGWIFFLGYYAEIFLAAPFFSVMFAVEGALLSVAGSLGRLEFAWGGDWIRRLGVMLLFYAVVVHPLVGPAFGREWRGVELFLLAPDPTAIGTLGLLLMSPGRSHWILALLPLLWCVLSGATLWVMEAYEGLMILAAALLAGIAMAWRR